MARVENMMEKQTTGKCQQRVGQVMLIGITVLRAMGGCNGTLILNTTPTWNNSPCHPYLYKCPSPDSRSGPSRWQLELVRSYSLMVCIPVHDEEPQRDHKGRSPKSMEVRRHAPKTGSADYYVKNRVLLCCTWYMVRTTHHIF